MPKRLGPKRLGPKRLGAETSRGRNGLVPKRLVTIRYSIVLWKYNRVNVQKRPVIQGRENNDEIYMPSRPWIDR